MSQYLLLKKVSVQNANAIAGLTYGFPAITNFLGFTHALSRKLPETLAVNLGGVAVISHKNTVHARQPKGWGDYVFALSRNPLTHQGKTAPINEEGRMHMQISLLIEVNGLIAGDTETAEQLIEQVKQKVPTLRLAGGQITHVENIELTPLNKEQKTLRKLMPGFALIDRSDYLAEYFQQQKSINDNACLFDAWCDFAKLKFKAEKITSKDEQETDALESVKQKANWHYVAKPQSGYLVPINTGYCAISPVYEAGEVSNVRDATVPTAFAESAYSVGEWKSVHNIKNIEVAVWRYEHQYPWYVAKTSPFEDEIIEPDSFDHDEAMNF
ncbi:type I-F CRISPR-associated protein Csy2 [Pseudoalteromonas sp. 20-92]|uniref:type I-F CRISPR-associated protein Csy2 n=1 Tax=Pseudoalteromonas sp. 20-92 TaxID=2969394 RepID=UPI0027B62FCC|nr:type I-F CRISPR-associated protein Csy2 [Pseudoalteromonas sp. 20-92]MDQ2043549.1 type I-F CRISPR-associated protein Csy2 [Pseudoalteromonas sp. 20-92]